MQGAKSFDLYEDNSRMVPRHMTPAVHKMVMTVSKFDVPRYVLLITSQLIILQQLYALLLIIGSVLPSKVLVNGTSVSLVQFLE